MVKFFLCKFYWEDFNHIIHPPKENLRTQSKGYSIENNHTNALENLTTPHRFKLCTKLCLRYSNFTSRNFFYFGTGVLVTIGQSASLHESAVVFH